MPPEPQPRSMSLAASLYLFHHIFLPPQLPQADDYSPECDMILLKRVTEALGTFSSHVSSQDTSVITAGISMMEALRAICGGKGEVNEKALIDALNQLETKGGFLPIHVRQQNAAILLSRTDDAINVESFELSPRNEAVMAAVGRLKRVFPGPTLALDRSTFNEPDFQKAVAQTIARMSNQSVPGTMLKVKKAGQMHDEDRDTTHPKMVTEFLMAILRPRCIDISALQIQKNTREEVLWKDSRSPWRRTALWLLVRVVLQLVFQRERGSDDLYKSFMIFFMAYIIEMSSVEVPTENLYLMNAKIARRLVKMDLSEEPDWFYFVNRILIQAQRTIQGRWQEIMRRTHQPDVLSLIELKFDQDIFCALPNVDKYLREIQRRSQTDSLAVQNYQPPTNLRIFTPTELPVNLDFADPGYQIHNLAALEDWVAVNLEKWLDEHQDNEDTCGRLGGLMTKYHKAASSMYSNKPEALSVMILTLLELWIACDKSAIHFHELLKEYDPCIPPGIFQSLLLCFRSQMERLARAEAYLNQRKEDSTYRGNRLFREYGTLSCFSVRYFEQSDHHKALHKSIEDHASRARAKKEQELEQKRQEYNRLKELANQDDCEYEEVMIYGEHEMKESQHSPSCIRCRYEDEANAIEIDIYEWPLPTNLLEAKSTVFELKVPPPFGCWRDTTVFFIIDVLLFEYPSNNPPRVKYSLGTYRGLSSFFVPFKNSQRIGLLSQDKPHAGTHRKSKQVANVAIDDICLPNALNFKYFDNLLGCFVGIFECKPSTAETPLKLLEMCTYQLPRHSSFLQQFLYRPAEKPNGPSPNTVIASQHAAPKNMSLGEYKALATLPLGVEIQWLNILRELLSSTLDLKKVETVKFLLQIINQAGPPHSRTELRRGHEILRDEKFASEILARIEKTKETIKENWAFVQGMCALIFLASRVFSLSDSQDIQNLCIYRLLELRHIAFDWINLVRVEMNQATNDKIKTKLAARSFEIALVCVETFNVESLPRAFATASDISIYIQCCIMIDDWKNALSMNPNSLRSILFHRWQKLAYRSYPIIAAKIVYEGDQGLDTALQEIWAAYTPQMGWSILMEGADYWLTTMVTTESSQSAGMSVHINLLTGELLVNGLPLARLPSHYKQHQTHQRLFGKSQLDVIPSDIPGMKFSCRNQYMAHTIHLGYNEADLLVRSEKDNRVWELIPSWVFQNSFPDAFVKNYVHWYDVNEGHVELRPVKDPWLSSASNWHLKKSQPYGSWFLEKQRSSLICIGSQTAKLLSKIFDPIEKATMIHCIWNRLTKTLEIEIPRLRLGFALQPQCSMIQSRQHLGWFVDVDQKLGSLFGLRNKMLLVEAKTQDRMLLIPEGEVTWKENSGHVDTNICWQDDTKLHYYLVDESLGILRDNGSLQSKLFLAYLHGVTSFCLPDPLLKKTGTEQALAILRSASMKSFDQPLAPEHEKVLEKIASLTPERKYYPASERAMQTVSWQLHLCSLSQHEAFYEEVNSIFEYDHDRGVFYPDTEPRRFSLPVVDSHLLSRAKIRSSSFRVSGSGAEDHTHEYDTQYDSLDRVRETTQGQQAFTLCKMLYDDIPCTQHVETQECFADIWKFLCRANRVHGADTEVDIKRIGYDTSMIPDKGTFVASYWCSLHRLLCARDSRLNKFIFMIWLSTMAFTECANMTVLGMIASWYIMPNAASVLPPHGESFRPSDGCQLIKEKLRALIEFKYRPKTPESNFVREPNESQTRFQKRKRDTRDSNRQWALKVLADHLENYWNMQPNTPLVTSTIDAKVDYYVDVQYVMNRVKDWFDMFQRNKRLGQYLLNLVALLDNEMVQSVEMPRYSYDHHSRCAQRKRGFVGFEDLLDTAPDIDLPCPEIRHFFPMVSRERVPAPHITGFVETLRPQAKSRYEEWYVDQLQSSASSLQRAERAIDNKPVTTMSQGKISEYISNCQEYADRVYAVITSQMTCSNMTARDSGETFRSRVLTTLAALNHFPRVSPILLLEQLSRNRWHHVPVNWKRALITYGCSLTRLQQAKRLAKLANNPDGLSRELQNVGHTNWNPFDYPESLLVEIENGILIRDVQEDIAKQMRESGENAVMQLNMGEGKSSVIVPIVAAALANGSCLVRVVVAKPQSRQMFQMLVSKLGGLLGRRVYQMPVARSLKLDQAGADNIERMCRECIKQGGILLMQPEHILSLKLMCIECFILEKYGVGRSLLRILQLFFKSCRDVVDESDENFNVKFELIYTMGVQRPTEHSPERWLLIHQLLDLVRMYVSDIKEEFPRSIEVDQHNHGGFPRVRLLRADAEKELISRIATHICDYGIGSLPISRQPPVVRRAVLTYIKVSDLADEQIAAVETSGPTGFWTESTKDSLLLLRGLLAGGVLAFCLTNKRWRVNYGPDPGRDPPTRLCVPYRAKDNPSLRSEFSHPDVVLVLTSLNYYYSGLSDEDLLLALHHLVKSDQADIEYQEWVRDAPALDNAYRQLVGVNLENQQHCSDSIFPALRFSKPAIDYFLARLVFPKELREFPDKLSASGWDIGEVKAKPTVGFSGTNDSRKTLPLSVRQLDLPEQNHTNALVIEHLLQAENSVVFIPDRDISSKSDAQCLLDLVSSLSPPTQVILDVGAQILELCNMQVAKRWLEMLPKEGPIQGIVFVDDKDEIVVLDRNERVEPLQVSPFARQMEACFVFLDEAHTRGIDLKLPPKYRAAVTLGPGITKDKLVQACMRMRNLGNGQSVVFCVPQEIRFKIMELRGNDDSSNISLMDVLCWAVRETWSEIRRGIPLWAVQGMRFERHSMIWRDVRARSFRDMNPADADRFLEPECQTLEHRYRPGREDKGRIHDAEDGNENLRLIRDRCHELESLDLASATLQEEQERELAPEIEREREVQRPQPAIPENHEVHPDLKAFVTTGKIKPNSKAYGPAFKTLGNTSAAEHLDVSQFPPHILVTKDFATTVQPFPGSRFTADAYQRQVNWILTGGARDTSTETSLVTKMIIISPLEAQELMDDIRKSKFCTLHLYTPRQNRSFPSLDRLMLYNISQTPCKIEVPDSLRILLNIFAGQLYLDSYAEYQRLCEFLGVASVKTSENLVVEPDGFISKGGDQTKTPFRQSPLEFLKVLLSEIRHDCEDIDKTHLGKILAGQFLYPFDFEDSL